MTVTDLPWNLSQNRGIRSMAWLLMLALGTACCSCQQNDPPPAEPVTIVLADTRSKALFTAPAETTLPAVHPQTGKPTLVRAWYCPKCQTWYPVPPAEVLQRNPKSGKCPKTGTTLQAKGPLPTGAIELKTGM